MKRCNSMLPLALAGLCCLATPAFAQRIMRPDTAPEPLAHERNSPLKPAQVVKVDKSTFAITYDDGEADNGYGASSDFYDAVMRFDLPKAPLQVDELTVCFSRLGTDDELGFDLTFWAADGPGGGAGPVAGPGLSHPAPCSTWYQPSPATCPRT